MHCTESAADLYVCCIVQISHSIIQELCGTEHSVKFFFKKIGVLKHPIGEQKNPECNGTLHKGVTEHLWGAQLKWQK